MKLSISTEWLYFHLWKRNPETGSSCPGVIIPDTIIFRYYIYVRWAQPYFWYYTTSDGQINRKTKDKIQIDYLFEVFSNGQDLSNLDPNQSNYQAEQEKHNN